MPQLNKGDTFADGQQVTGARLNQLVDSATLLPGAITDQSAVTSNDVQSADRVLIYDDSATALRKATVGDVLNASLATKFSSIDGPTAADLTVVPAAGQKVDLQGAFQVLGATTLDNTATVNGKMTLSTTGAVKIPVGTTAQRPASPVIGDMRFNSTTTKAEIYNGTAWKEVGGVPFEASGGSTILAPEATVLSATFTSANGIDITVTVSAGHTCSVGQIIDLQTAVSGYSGYYAVRSIGGLTLTVRKGGTAATPVTSQACTVQKAGNHKVHIFTTSGTFTCTSVDGGEVDVLVVAGGGGGDVGTSPARGGGGGHVLKRAIPVSAGQSISVTVGSGGAAVTVGGNSSFGTITANGGTAGTGSSQTYNVALKGGNSEIASYPVFPMYANSGTLLTPPHNGTTTPPANQYALNGVLSDITNIETWYGVGGANKSDTPVANTGHGGFSTGTGTPVGSSGIVIVRYPYKLQT